jgi:sugar (pentulose or hexulose) kinase
VVRLADLLVGVDVGTSSVKAAVCDTAGRELCHGGAPLEWRTSGSGTEIEPEQVLRAVHEALSAALSSAPDGRVAAIGVTSMAETGVLLDGNGRPVAPLIAWHDARDGAERDRLGAELGAEAFSVTTGLPLSTQWSLTKHRWLRDHHAATAQAVRRLNIAEWVVHALGGEQVAEYSLSSRTGWLSLRDRTWWSAALEWSGATQDLFPPLVQAGTPLGRVGPDRAGERLVGALLTVAGHDHLAASVGASAAGDGEILDSCGSAEALVHTVRAPLPDSAVAHLTDHGVTAGWHVLPERLSVLGATRGGLFMRQVLRLLGRELAQLPELDRSAMRLEAGSLRARFEPDNTVTLCGIGADATPAAAWRAALEAATEEAVRMRAIVSSAMSDQGKVVMTGGWSHSEAVVALRRQAFGDAERSPAVEAGARGAALLGGCAAGVFANPFKLPVPRAVRIQA